MDDDKLDRGDPPAPDSPERFEDEPDVSREEGIAGETADDEDIADPERYKKGPGW